VKQLVSKIQEFVHAYNKNCKPFMWYATAESIFEKLGRLCERISGTGHHETNVIGGRRPALQVEAVIFACLRSATCGFTVLVKDVLSGAVHGFEETVWDANEAVSWN
jgi:hypothetical protein